LNAPVRSFPATLAVLKEVPLLIGLEGPPGGGKTYSALRLAKGMQRIRPGPVVVIDTERGRASKYAAEFEFLHVDFRPPFKPTDFLAAVREQLKLNPAAIVIDSQSDEHEGEGGVIDWHDAEVARFSGNEHAAWAKPKADRKRMINGYLQITTPLILTFRAREKTVQQPKANGHGKEVVNIGFQPIAPAEIVYALDLVCLLPVRANGVPQWKSDKVGENFTTKLPNYLAPFIQEGRPLSEEMGEAFAKWAKGGPAAPAQRAQTADPPRGQSDAPPPQTPAQQASSAQGQSSLTDRVNTVVSAMAKAANQAELDAIWRRAEQLRGEVEEKDPEGLLVTLDDAYAGACRALNPDPAAMATDAY
jgi:hypothetical protein